MVARGDLRRVDRGLYDRPATNKLTGRPTVPNYRAVVDALARRDQTQLLLDGMTAANDLGLTNGVPARVTLYTDTRRRTIQLDQLTIEFKQAAPSRLYWAGRPAMRVVQSLRWLKDMLPTDGDRIRNVLARLLSDRAHGDKIRGDLVQGSRFCRSGCKAFCAPSPASIPHKNWINPSRAPRHRANHRKPLTRRSHDEPHLFPNHCGERRRPGRPVRRSGCPPGHRHPECRKKLLRMLDARRAFQWARAR